MPGKSHNRKLTHYQPVVRNERCDLRLSTAPAPQSGEFHWFCMGLEGWVRRELRNRYLRFDYASWQRRADAKTLCYIAKLA
jgi:hypothetical protein